ncbi:MAG: hypothetical protein SGPRY_008140 [Prymnesium sp.]
MRQGDTSTRDAYTIGTLPPLHLQKDNVHLLLMSLANAPAEYVHKRIQIIPLSVCAVPAYFLHAHGLPPPDRSIPTGMSGHRTAHRDPPKRRRCVRRLNPRIKPSSRT